MGFELKEFRNMGMKQDTSPSRAEENFVFENRNIRITSTEDNTLLSVTNEKGAKLLPQNIQKRLYKTVNLITVEKTTRGKVTARSTYPVEKTLLIKVKYFISPSRQDIFFGTFRSGTSECEIEAPLEYYPRFAYSLVESDVVEDDSYLYTTDKNFERYPHEQTSILGQYVGHCVLNKYLILFTTESGIDRIYRLEISEGTIEGILLFQGYLNLSHGKSFEALAYYESEEVQKVYWVDGVNSNRVINIIKEYSGESSSVDNIYTGFDFCPTVDKFPNILVETKYEGAGMFNSGVIQYFITYYNKFGAETKIVGQTGLHKISPLKRGGKVNELCDCSFKLTINNIDSNFDYLRIYSAQRSSLDGPIEVHIVKDVKINSNEIVFIDGNISQQAVDSSMLSYIGGSDFKASTLCQKNDTLFLGDLSLEGADLSIEDKDIINNSFIEAESTGINKCIHVSTVGTLIEGNTAVFPVSDKYFDYKYLKRGEIYRLAIQFQDNKGNWTSPVWIGDTTHGISPSIGPYGSMDSPDHVYLPQTKFTYPENLGISDKYKKYRILRAATNYNNRSILTQGLVCPTLFNYEERCNNTPYSIASWIMRPDSGDVPYNHMEGMSPLGEIQSVMEVQGPPKVEERASVSKVLVMFSPGFNADGYGMMAVVKIPYDKSGYSARSEETTPLYTPGFYKPNSETYNKFTSYLNGLGIDFTSLVSEEVFTSSAPQHWNNSLPEEYSRWLASLNASNLSIPWGYLDSRPAVYKQLEIEGDVGYDRNEDILAKKNNFYVDSNILTLHSPNMSSIEDLINDRDVKFRIVGCAKITDNKTKSLIETETVGVNKKSEILDTMLQGKTLVSDYLYRDALLDGKIFSIVLVATYNVHLWNKTNSLSGWKEGAKDIDYIPAKLKHKIFANYRISSSSNYFTPIEYSNVKPKVFNSEELTTIPIEVDKKILYYYGNYDKLLVDSEYKVSTKEFGVGISEKTLIQDDSIRIKFKSTPHIVFGLQNRALLPYRESDGPFDFTELYPSAQEGLRYPWLDNNEEYSNNDYCNSFIENETPILYIAELYRDLDYNSLYGGYSQEDLEKIEWLPASALTNVGSDTIIHGDTYFGSWECLKTYPYTEEDENSVVDITKVYIESFDNLGGRVDINTEGNNMLNARPTNFNMFNSVYNQEDNIFKYYILDEKFDVNEYSNQITWSLTKTPNDDVDAWTNISLASLLTLDGSHGSINKLINVNDSIVAFQDKAIASIQYNERTQISTESGMPVEIQNSGKVTGYQYASTSIGCDNKYSISESQAGVYFIDGLNGTFNRLGKDGIVDISALGMKTWFRKHNMNSFRTYYDSTTHDLYIVNNDEALIFNEDLSAFTSFMDYIKGHSVININGKSLLVDIGTISKIHQMYAGIYGEGLEGETLNYYIDYLVNPEPTINKVFTNVEFTASVTDPKKSISDKLSNTGNKPFDKVVVWNEYQYGEQNFSTPLGELIKNKFRLWRFQIPRDSNSKFKHDRIQGPWAHLKLENTSKCLDKVSINGLILKYFK